MGFRMRRMMVVGLLVALSQVGIEIAPLLTGLGIAGFIIGFALQDTLSNFAAGGMILGYRPFDIGDFIETFPMSQINEVFKNTLDNKYTKRSVMVPDFE